ncbi:hypothetical protein C2845_PM14G04880 [Panicum miliaceum]|uniref:EF-hand domain-containing protein n=1 Tax=Panicum miliaceum TaxID=4540 RepID=A0A3L6PNE1_PANMI|nr:hypothetical protein C2845_PM14G04880 [Panicum miliaceum]
MAAVGGMLASPVLNMVVKQIGAVIGGQITLQKDFTKDLRKMKMMLESVAAVMKDAERQSIEEREVQLWLKRLKDAMYGISDMLDEFEADTQSAARKISLKKDLLQLASACLSVCPKINLANRMKEMREELKVITDQHKDFMLKPGTITNELKITDTHDLWEDNASQLDDLKDMLKVGEQSRIVVIVTTRNEGIANKFRTIKPYKLAPLSNDSCWIIIKQKSSFDSRDDKHEVEQIGKDIAVMCGGMALAAQSLGYMLKKLTSDEWESVRKKETNIFSTEQLGEKYISQLLGLSFLEHSRLHNSASWAYSHCKLNLSPECNNVLSVILGLAPESPASGVGAPLLAAQHRLQAACPPRGSGLPQPRSTPAAGKEQRRRPHLLARAPSRRSRPSPAPPAEEEATVEEARAAFAAFDRDGDGFIDAAERQRMIDAYDEDRDGKIDFSELVKLMETSS